MSKLTNNEINNGFHCTGRFPLRANEILKSVEDLYIGGDKSESEDEKVSLFNQVYPGMVVKFRGTDGKFEVWVNINNEPYLPDGHELKVDSSNIETYWSRIWPKTAALSTLSLKSSKKKQAK